MLKQINLKSFSILLSFLLCFLIVPVLAGGVLIVEPDEGRQPIIKALQQAHASIDLAMYGFTDPELMQAFIDAKDKGKNVRILLQHFPYKNADENLLAIQRFSAKKMNLTYAPPAFYLLHQKTLLIDQHLALIFTFNFTRSTFEKERNFGLIIKDPARIKEIQDVFNADWQNKKIVPNDSNLVWSPDNSRAKILGLIGSAKTEIKIYAQGLTDYEMVGALAHAAQRGVKIQVMTSDTEAEKKLAYLQKNGVQVALDKQLIIHAKVLILDREKALLGSINLTQPSLDKNRELSVLVDDPKLVQKLLETFDNDWRQSQN